MKRIKERDGARKVTVVLVAVTALVVFGTLVGAMYFTPERVAKHELTAMAMDYYENYIYPDILSDAKNESEIYAAFEDVAKEGIKNVKLRRLLHFDDDKNIGKAGAFDNDNYYCDPNQTSVTIIPYEPFKKTDYKIEYNYSCEKRGNVIKFE